MSIDSEPIVPEVVCPLDTTDKAVPPHNFNKLGDRMMNLYNELKMGIGEVKL